MTTSMTRGEYICPICRAVHKVPDKGVDEIQKNFYVTEMQEMASAMKPKHPICKDHETEDLRFYCVDCEIPICRDCKAVGHEGHKISLISNVAKEKRAEVLKIIPCVEFRGERLKTQFAKYRDRIMNHQIPKAEDISKEIERKVEALRNRLSVLLDYIKRDIENWKSGMMDEFKINRNKYDDARNSLNRFREQLTAVSPGSMDDASSIRSYDKLLKESSILTGNSIISLDIAVPTNSDAFMECFGKFIFQTNLELYNFQKKYYGNLERVFSIRGEKIEDQICSDKKTHNNNKSKKTSEEQPGPSGEPSRKKPRADTADTPVARRRRPFTIELSSAEESDSDDSL